MFTVVSALLIVACLLPATAKLGGHPRMRESARHFSISWRRYRLIGGAEWPLRRESWRACSGIRSA